MKTEDAAAVQQLVEKLLRCHGFLAGSGQQGVLGFVQRDTNLAASAKLLFNADQNNEDRAD